jgi:hypothetical protein
MALTGEKSAACNDILFADDYLRKILAPRPHCQSGRTAPSYFYQSSWNFAPAFFAAHCLPLTAHAFLDCLFRPNFVRSSSSFHPRLHRLGRRSLGEGGSPRPYSPLRPAVCQIPTIKSAPTSALTALIEISDFVLLCL